MHSERINIVSGSPFSTFLLLLGLPNYLTCSYVMSSLSAIATSPTAQFTPLCTSSLLTHIFASSINNTLLYPDCLCFSCIKGPSKT
ncbi:hypothetical protein CH063_14518 [Colletotrichum higginsianum]|uniref:Uncharacterized protein n=1 Tax=Colletotrichum higginsianum (strain IMI 349063) TaxID=759273 RepID=H1VYW7_COLHI|nr:hypothetical protein CH063_13448 [Colletotrichum higginsianum]CCF45429.1 hypothetical protein CH063_14518 [Colletotrichum higginsianum]